VLIEGVARQDRALFLAALERQLAGECTELRYRVVRPDGSVRWVWDRAFPVRDQSGKLVRILALAVDVTEEHEAAPRDDQAARRAAMEQAARARDEFLSAMSHELRTPLNAVLGACEALRDGLYGTLTEPQQNAVGRVEEGGRRLLSVVDAVLDFSNLAAGGVDLERRPAPIDELCRSALSQVRDAARRKQLRVSFEVTDGFTTADVDAARVVQILVALLRNAVKFTPEGGAIGVVAGVDASKKRAVFTVWDEGIGIAEAELGRLFRPFVQVDAGLARQHGGAGLGLAIARRLVDMHGGELSVESQPAKGSRFIVEMPLAARPSH
jgi:signal transduction histidine kinase